MRISSYIRYILVLFGRLGLHHSVPLHFWDCLKQPLVGELLLISLRGVIGPN